MLGFGFLGLLPRGLVISYTGSRFILFPPVLRECLLLIQFRVFQFFGIPKSETSGTIMESLFICRMTQLSFEGVRVLPPLRTNLYGFPEFLYSMMVLYKDSVVRTELFLKRKSFSKSINSKTTYRNSHGGRWLLMEFFEDLRVYFSPFNLR